MIRNDKAEHGVSARAGTLCMSAQLAERIRRHGVEAYPEECCGALLGRAAGCDAGAEGTREVLEVIALENQWRDSARSRFLVEPRDVLGVEKGAKARGLELIGWYHSHPDHPAQPSKYDRENAWPWYSYVILRVQDGVPQEMTAWRLRDDRTEFLEETVALRDRTPSS